MTDSNLGFVSYKGFRYPIDETKSRLTAHIFSVGLSWNLEVMTLDDPRYVEIDEAPTCSPSMYVSFQVTGLKDWRELANRRFTVDYKRLADEILLPDQPASLYLGYHVFPDQHEIVFGERDVSKFRLQWHLEAGQLRDHYVLDVDGIIPFSAAIVHFPEDVPKFESESTTEDIENEFIEWEPDFGKAQQMISTYFTLSDFGTPQKWRWALRFPVIARE
jgi:hypothetical protein